MLPKRRKQKGLSILEIIIAGLILTTAFMTLAFVYPSGFKLTESNKKTSEATEIARSIMEEIKLLPFQSYRGGVTKDIQTWELASFQDTKPFWPQSNWPFNHYKDAGNGWAERTPVHLVAGGVLNVPQVMTDMEAQNKRYFIMDATVNVIIAPANATELNQYNARTAEITVPVYWLETRPDRQIVKSVTLTDIVTENKY